MRPRRHLTLHVTNHKYWNPTCESEEEKNNTPNKESNCSIRYSRNSKLPFPILFKLFLLFRCWSSPVNRHAPSIISQLGKPHRREEVSSRGAARTPAKRRARQSASPTTPRRGDTGYLLPQPAIKSNFRETDPEGPSTTPARLQLHAPSHYARVCVCTTQFPYRLAPSSPGRGTECNFSQLPRYHRRSPRAR